MTRYTTETDSIIYLERAAKLVWAANEDVNICVRPTLRGTDVVTFLGYIQNYASQWAAAMRDQ